MYSELFYIAVIPSLPGGTELEVTGTGFDDSAVVTVGDVECTIISHNATSITCMTPAGADGTAEVAVDVQGTTATSSDDFTYSASDTPEINDFQPTSSSVSGQCVILPLHGGK